MDERIDHVCGIDPRMTLIYEKWADVSR